MTYLVNIKFMHNIVYSKDSIRELNEISGYISIDNPLKAKIVLENIYSNIDYLLVFPFIWKEIKNWYRQLVETNYKFKIVYKILNQTIYIISIFKYKDTF